jgi:ATP-binding cassette subfamily A (ABC1) protein 3
VLPRQTWTLTVKTLLIAFIRHPSSTILRALILPIIFMIFLANARRFFVPPAYFGIGEASPVKDLAVAMDAASGGRNTLVFVNGGFEGGDIEKVINQSMGLVEGKGKVVKMLRNETELVDICRNTLRLVSTCFAAAVFHSSPTEGPGGIWNYTIRTDAALGSRLDVRKSTNDIELYIIPLQNTIDTIIASLNTTIDHSSLPSRVYEYPYTSRTNQEREDRIRSIFMNGIIDYTAVAFFVGVVGVIYQLVGFVATERETGMAQLIDAMATNIRPWQPQVARLVSHHFAFDIIYLPGWVIMALVLANGLFTKTSTWLLILFHILAGLSLTSFSIFGAAFFRKSQLSGIATTIIAIVLAIGAQIVSKGGAHTGTVTVLGLLFPPMTYVFFFINMARWQKGNNPTELVHRPPDGTWGTVGIVLWIFLIIQTFMYPFLGALVERWLYGTSSKARSVVSDTDADTPTVQLTDFSKHYPPNWFFRYVAPLFGKHKETVVAVNGLTLGMIKGHITVLLGANGSGKTTTLECIAGLLRVNSGSIRVNGTGGLGICPQKVHHPLEYLISTF